MSLVLAEEVTQDGDRGGQKVDELCGADADKLRQLVEKHRCVSVYPITWAATTKDGQCLLKQCMGRMVDPC